LLFELTKLFGGSIMKSKILALAFIAFLIPQVQATEPLTLRQHMTAMGYLLDEVWVSVGTPPDYTKAADKVNELRGHLVQVIGLLPPKIEIMQPTEKRLATIEFHQFAARVIYLTATLENTLLKPDLSPISQSRDRDIANVLHEISSAVGSAHGKFR
jgi:hypothetical protein